MIKIITNLIKFSCNSRIFKGYVKILADICHSRRVLAGIWGFVSNDGFVPELIQSGTEDFGNDIGFHDSICKSPQDFLRNLFKLFLLLFITHNSYAAFSSSYHGGRPAGMGGAFIAVADDANSIIFNPAGLGRQKYIESGFSYSKLYTGLDGVNLGLQYFNVAMPVENYGGFGFGWINFSSLNEYHEDTFIMSYGRNINDKVLLGASVKYLGHRFVLDNRTTNDPVFASGNSKYSFSLDAGALTNFSISNNNDSISAGIAARNITRPDVGLKSEDAVPPEIGLGLAYKRGANILPALDIIYRFQDWGTADDKLIVKAGLEAWFHDHLLGLRAGYDRSDISIGVGFNPVLWNTQVGIDYSFLFPLQLKETSGTHQLAISLKFLK